MILSRNRSYIDTTCPRDDMGREIGAAHGDEFERYIDWLAEYLFRTEIPVPENQKQLLQEYQEKGADHAVFDLSECLGYSEEPWDYDCYTSYDDYRMHMLEAFGTLSQEEQREYLYGENVEGTYYMSGIDYARCKSEFDEAKKVPEHISHADIPYRPVLAALFKCIPEHDKRKELLEYFYSNLNENLSK